LALPPELADELRSLAETHGTSKAAVIRRALQKYLDTTRVAPDDPLSNLTSAIYEDSARPGKRFVEPSTRISPVNRSSRSASARPVRVEIVPFGQILATELRHDPTAIHSLTPDEFEQFVCERLFAMGFEPKRVGRYNQRDGGIDVLFWPKVCRNFPFLGAAQVKHHNPCRNVSPPSVREFAAVIASHPINAGLIVTNTTFTADARWFARERAKLLRLRDFEDIKRWIENDFGSEHEWREIPASIELAPGLVVELNRNA
jgi:hypothetical protein